MRKRVVFFVLGFLIILALILTSCAPKVSTASTPTTKPATGATATSNQPTYGGTLVIASQYAIL